MIAKKDYLTNLTHSNKLAWSDSGINSEFNWQLNKLGINSVRIMAKKVCKNLSQKFYIV